jgi:UDP-glucose 4-epimerase
LRQKLAGQPLTVVGDGTQRRDFVHVKDVAEAFCLAAESPLSGEIWNCGANNPKTINALVELIGGTVTYIPKRPGEPDCTWADTSKIERELGWRSEVTFRDGVAEMLHEIDRWSEAPLWTPESIAKATASWFQALEER